MSGARWGDGVLGGMKGWRSDGEILFLRKNQENIVGTWLLPGRLFLELSVPWQAESRVK